MSTSVYNTPTRTTCDQCNHEFQIEMKAVRRMGAGERTYFNCPHCGKRYGVAIVSERGLTVRDHLNAAIGEARKDASKQPVVDKLKRELAKEMKRWA